MANGRLASLVAAMEAEAEALDGYVEGQKDFAQAIRDRDWPRLQACMSRLQGLAEEIARIEADRAEAEAALRAELGCDEAGFYRLAFHVSEPERSLLADLYRRLKIAAMRARLETASSGEYAAGSRELLGAVLEELFPEKKGRIYGRTGRAREPEAGAMVLNAAF